MITDESLKQQNRPEPLEKATHVTDNISELLLSIIHFTRARHKTLIKNIRNVNIPGFIPTDLPCRQFANQMNVALDSHQISNTLLMADTEHISFLGDGQFEVNSIPDPRAQELLDTNKEQYIQFEVDKIIENAVSQRFAAQLLREKEQSQAAPN